jgi:hypothetical protein
MTTLTRFQAMRMIWIDAWLTRCPDIGLNRRHICFGFDLSVQQASHDLNLFDDLFPNRLVYNESVKAFFANPASSPAFEPWQHESVFAAGRAAAAFCDNPGSLPA